MSHSGITNAHPDWLKQVKEVTVTAEHAQGRSETGATLAAIADGMDQESEPFAAGEVMGVVIERGVSVVRAVMVSAGKSSDDVARIAREYGVDETNISLMSAVVMLKQDFGGVARLVEFIQGK